MIELVVEGDVGFGFVFGEREGGLGLGLFFGSGFHGFVEMGEFLFELGED